MNSRQWYVQKVPFVSEYFLTAFGSFRQFSGGYSRKFYTGRLDPEVQPVTLLYIILTEKVPPFFIPSIDSWYTYYIPSYESPNPFNLCECTVFKI